LKALTRPPPFSLLSAGSSGAVTAAVFAVEQGRKIYDNLTKYTLFVLVIFVPTFLGTTLFNTATCAPFTPVQVPRWLRARL
jgi:magnesium-transporting ATPase (P-type)